MHSFHIEMCAMWVMHGANVVLMVSRYWAVQLSGATVGSTAIELTAGVAIIDTGSTAITVGAVDGDAIHAVRCSMIC